MSCNAAPCPWSSSCFSPSSVASDQLLSMVNIPPPPLIQLKFKHSPLSPSPSAHSTHGGGEAEPQFLAPLENITAVQGRDVVFTCVADNLGEYRVRHSLLLTECCISIRRGPPSLCCLMVCRSPGSSRIQRPSWPFTRTWWR